MKIKSNKFENQASKIFEDSVTKQFIFYFIHFPFKIYKKYIIVRRTYYGTDFDFQTT